MIRLYIDECVHGAITRGLLRRRIDALTVQEDGRAHATDAEVIARAAELRRVVFTNDPDLLQLAHEYQASGVLFNGIIFAVQRTPIGVCVADLELLATCTEATEWRDVVRYVPFA